MIAISALFAAFFLVTVVELIAYSRWNGLYFRTGLAIFRDEADAQSPQADLPLPKDLEHRLENPKWKPVLFRQIGPDMMAFREAAWGYFDRGSYTPVMRGVVKFDRNRSKVFVRGPLMYFSLAFVAVFAGESYRFGAPWMSLFAVALYAGLFVIQVRRFRQVAELAAAAWSSSVIQTS